MVSLRGTNQEFGRPYNRRIVLEAIRLHGPIERADIARRVGLTVQTVANIIRELEDLDLVTGSRAQPKGRGSPATSLSINPAGGYTIGVHVAQFKLEAARVDLAGSISATVERNIDTAAPAGAFAAIGDMIAELSDAKDRRLLGVGLAMPGPFDVDSMSFVGPTTLEGWRGFPIEQRLAEVAAAPAFIEADSAAAALGERLHGAGRSIRDFFYLYFGVGLGGSVEKLFYLPEAHTDFLLAVIAEELGLIGVLAVIVLFGLIVQRAFAIGRQALLLERVYAGLVAQGIGIWIGVQAFINMGVNMGLLPTKGLTLPLMSFGGSGILANCVALAILLRVDWENRQLMRGQSV